MSNSIGIGKLNISNSIGIGKGNKSNSIGFGKLKMSFSFGIEKRNQKSYYIDIFKTRSDLNYTHTKKWLLMLAHFAQAKNISFNVNSKQSKMCTVNTQGVIWIN